MNRLLFIILYLLSYEVYCQNDSTINLSNYDSITYHKNGTHSELGSYDKKGRKNGVFVLYDSTNCLVETGEYSKGKKIGFWNEDNLRGNYRRGKKSGEWHSYSSIFLYRRGKIKRQKFIQWNN